MTIAPTTEYFREIRHLNQKRVFQIKTIAGGQRVDPG